MRQGRLRSGSWRQGKASIGCSTQETRVSRLEVLGRTGAEASATAKVLGEVVSDLFRNVEQLSQEVASAQVGTTGDFREVQNTLLKRVSELEGKSAEATVARANTREQISAMQLENAATVEAISTAQALIATLSDQIDDRVALVDLRVNAAEQKSVASLDLSNTTNQMVARIGHTLSNPHLSKRSIETFNLKVKGQEGEVITLGRVATTGAEGGAFAEEDEETSATSEERFSALEALVARVLALSGRNHLDIVALRGASTLDTAPASP